MSSLPLAHPEAKGQKAPPVKGDRRSSNKGRDRGRGRGAGAHPEKVTIKAKGVSYSTQKVIGQGSFGVVYQALVDGGKEVVAIKKVLQDKRFKNRELQIMKLLNHPNVVSLRNSFYTNDDSLREVYLNLVLEYVPDTVYRVARQHSKLKQPIASISVKLYMYQLLRALGYVHGLGICHRDVKPQNLLLDPQTSVLKLCDFGSAKLMNGNPNVSYICSRYYRAPELIFGSTLYGNSIDVWSAGCVMAELMLGQPLFQGDSGVDQLVEIIRVLGTPTRHQIRCMNCDFNDFDFPQIKPIPWHKVFRGRTSPEAIDLVSKLLQYDPKNRILPLEALAHPFFDKLREGNVRLPNGRHTPTLFDFTETEIKGAEGFLNELIPPHHQIKGPSSDPVGEPKSLAGSKKKGDDGKGVDAGGEIETEKGDGGDEDQKSQELQGEQTQGADEEQKSSED